jgi:adenylate kinase family enzyme
MKTQFHSAKNLKRDEFNIPVLPSDEIDVSNGKINAKKILILGDAGRGKTTLARRLSELLGIRSYSTDDFYWKVKFSERAEKQKSIEKVKKVYAREEWIVEGTTLRLLRPGFEEADLIVYLEFQNIFQQWSALIKRNSKRKSETLSDLLRLLRHVLYKRYKLGYKRDDPRALELLQPYSDKLVVLSSIREIEEFIKESTV